RLVWLQEDFAMAVVAQAACLTDVFTLGFSTAANRFFITDRYLACLRFGLKGDFPANFKQLQFILTPNDQSGFEGLNFNPECWMGLHECVELLLKTRALFRVHRFDCERQQPVNLAAPACHLHSSDNGHWKRP